MAACRDREAEARAGYEAARTAWAAGDAAGALTALDGVVATDPTFVPARQLLADILLEKGEFAAAADQLRTALTTDPDLLQARITLAELALSNDEMTEARAQAEQAIRIDPRSPSSRALKIAIDYAQASLKHDMAATEMAVAQAKALLAGAPQMVAARRVLIDDRLAGATPEAALPDLDRAIADTPKSPEFLLAKAALLATLGRETERGATLARAYAAFPADHPVRDSYAAWLDAHGDPATIVAFQRDVAARAGNTREAKAALAAVIQRELGPAEAERELMAMAEAAPNIADRRYFHALAACADDAAGNSNLAVASLRSLITASEASADVDEFRAWLAEILDRQGDRPAAAKLVEELQARKSPQPVALKLSSRWQIEAGKPADAIVTLRQALELKPGDTDTLLLLARAYQGAGSDELAGQVLADAVAQSRRGVAESLALRRHLLATGRERLADEVLRSALNEHPDDPQLLLAEVRNAARQMDWPHATAVIERLDRLDGPQAAEMAGAARATLMNRRAAAKELEDALLDLRPSNDYGVDANFLLTMMNRQSPDDARTYVEKRLETAPADATLLHLSSLLAVLSAPDGEAHAAD